MKILITIGLIFGVLVLLVLIVLAIGFIEHFLEDNPEFQDWMDRFGR